MRDNCMKLTYYGHATVSIEVGGKRLLFDPFLTGNPSADGIDPGKLEADYIFITHGHGDHTADLLDVARHTGALCVAPFEIGEWLEKQGLKRVHSMNQGGAISFDFGKVRGVNAIHSSSFN